MQNQRSDLPHVFTIDIYHEFFVAFVIVLSCLTEVTFDIEKTV
jgi:hypothetical protein